MLKAAFFAIVLALVGAAVAQESQQPATPSQPPIPSAAEPGNENQQKAAANSQPATEDKYGTQVSPLIVEMLNPPNTDAIASELQKDRQERSANDRWTWIFSVLLVLVGAGQGLVLFWTARVANKAANAALVTANAVTAQMRAYVSVVSAKIYGFDQDGESRVMIRIGNSGDTVAFDVTGEYGVTIQKAEVFNFKGDLRPKDYGPISRSRAGMGPKTTFDSFNVIPKMAPDLKAAIRGGTHAVFAYGEIRYNDALKNPRRTTYRLMYGGAVGADPNGLFVTCEEGNDSD